MKSSEFITTHLESLVDSFPEIDCKYEYDALSNTHVIEILPLNVFKADEAYASREIEITDEFLNQFPDEGICFVSSDSIIEANNPIFHRTGLVFGINEKFDTYGWRTIDNLSLFKIDKFSLINRVDFIHYPIITSYFNTIGMEHINANFNLNFSGQFENWEKFENSFSIYVKDDSENKDEISCDDSNILPLAA